MKDVVTPFRAPKGGKIVGPLPVEIPEGSYDVAFTHYDTARPRESWNPKVVLTFSITAGDYAGTEVPYWCNVLSIKEHKKRGGEFEVGPRSKLVADHIRFFGRPESGRFDLDLDLWGYLTLRATVRTKQLKSGIPYSIITRLDRMN